MYDTSILNIVLNDLTQVRLDNFDIPPQMLSFTRSSIRIHDKDEIRLNEYLPKIEIRKQYNKTKNSIEYVLRLEFSIPKLLRNQNIESVSENQIDDIVKVLKQKLENLDIFVSEKDIEEATHSRIDPSMVVDVSQFLSCQTIISALTKVPVPSNVRINKNGYQNNGNSFVIDTDGWRFLVYDKLRESESSSATIPIDVDGKIENVPIKEAVKKKGIKHLLRIELQYVKASSIKKFLSENGYDSENLTFKYLFKQEIATKMLKNCWDKYIAPHLTSAALYRLQQRTIVDKAGSQNISINELSKLLGYKDIMKLCPNGYNNAKQIYRGKNTRTFLKEVEGTFEKLNLNKTTICKTFKYIYECITNPTPFKIRDDDSITYYKCISNNILEDYISSVVTDK